VLCTQPLARGPGDTGLQGQAQPVAVETPNPAGGGQRRPDFGVGSCPFLWALVKTSLSETC
jgi:hypothetical protein